MTADIIALIGFKHVGKSTLGNILAQRLQWLFYDLDSLIEEAYARQHGLNIACRQIMAQQGESAFRRLESAALQQIPIDEPAVIALGGGAPLSVENQAWLKHATVVHVTAQPESVLARILAAGVPQFFSADLPLQQAFEQLWFKRYPVYQALAQVTINNDSSLVRTIDTLWSSLAPIVSLPTLTE